MILRFQINSMDFGDCFVFTGASLTQRKCNCASDGIAILTPDEMRGRVSAVNGIFVSSS